MQIKAFTIRFHQAVNYFIKAAEILYVSDLSGAHNWTGLINLFSSALRSEIFSLASA